MTTETLAEWTPSWDKPIGTLIESFTYFDRDFVAVLQAQLLALHRAENKLNLFAVLNDGAQGIAKKLETLGVPRNAVVLAHADVDSNKGMPREVPPFGLIAKIIGFVTPEVCDQLLIVQAAARILKNSNLSLDNTPSLKDALDSPLYAHVGNNDKEPQELQSAQAYAHLALIHQSLVKETAALDIKYDGAYRRAAYASIAHDLLEKARDTLQKLGVEDAVKNIDAVLTEFSPMPKEHNPATAMTRQIAWAHHELIGDDRSDEVIRQVSIMQNRTHLALGNNNGSGAPGNDPKLTL